MLANLKPIYLHYLYLNMDLYKVYLDVVPAVYAASSVQYSSAQFKETIRKKPLGTFLSLVFLSLRLRMMVKEG